MPTRSRRSSSTKSRRAYARALRLAQGDLEQNKDEVLALLREAVADGYGPAEYALATWYLFGVGVRKNRVLAVPLLKKAAAKGIADAAFDLAVSYERGLGVASDKRQAFKLYTKAAELGDRQSVYEVGRCYYWGIGVAKDRQRAELWIARARRHKVPDALSDARVRRAVGERGRQGG